MLHPQLLGSAKMWPPQSWWGAGGVLNTTVLFLVIFPTTSLRQGILVLGCLASADSLVYPK